MWISIGFPVALYVLFWVLVRCADWPALTRGLIAFGSATSILGLFHWFQFLASPWQQESGRVVESQPLWPAFIVLGLPAIVCYYLYRYGKDDARHMSLTDYEPGVLPGGITLKAWEEAGEKGSRPSS